MAASVEQSVIEPRIWPGDQARFRPLRVEAEVVSAFSCHHAIALDALLASQVALRDGYPPPEVEERIPPAPLLWHSAGFHHASVAHYEVAGYDLRHWTKKTPQVQDLAALTKARKVNVAAGQFKPYYMPLRTQMPAGPLTWWCVGDPEEIAALLEGVTNLGAKAGHGYGRVTRWRVVTVEEDWSLTRPGDPGLAIEMEAERLDPGHLERVRQSGSMLGLIDCRVVARPLPVDLAPEGWMHLRMCRRTYPYWRHDGDELLAVPEPPREVGR